MAEFVIGKNKIVTVRSADRQSGTPSNFSINFSQFNLTGNYVSFHQVAMPNGFYNVNQRSNAMSVTVYSTSTNSTTGVTTTTSYLVNITVAAGNYTATGTNGILNACVSALNTQLVAVNGAAPANFFTGTSNSLTGYATLSSNTTGWSFSINMIGSLEFILGFRNSQVINKVTSATGLAIIDVRGPPSIHVRSSLVSGNYISNQGVDSVLCVVQNTALFTQTIFQRTPTADLDVFPVSGQISQIMFQLIDEYGNELTMDTNQDWEISIGLYS